MVLPKRIVDTHLHVWDPSRLRYPWLDDIPLLNRPYGLSDYDAAVGDLPVERTVFVQCEVEPAQYREEAEWVAALAEADGRLGAMVPWAPLERGRLAQADVEALAANPLVRGIRRIIQFEDSSDFCIQPQFVEGVSMLAELDLHFEICLKGDDQFRNCLELVGRCPDVRFILNHIGKPFINEGVMSPWSEFISELAAMPNTWCKVSGMANEADMDSWDADDLRPYLSHVISAYGWDRVMFGGDWPVALLATSFHAWVETLASMAVDVGAADKELTALFAGNAEAFYRL